MAAALVPDALWSLAHYFRLARYGRNPPHLRRTCRGSDSARWLADHCLQIRPAEKIGEAGVGAEAVQFGSKFEEVDVLPGVS